MSVSAVDVVASGSVVDSVVLAIANADGNVSATFFGAKLTRQQGHNTDSSPHRNSNTFVGLG